MTTGPVVGRDLPVRSRALTSPGVVENRVLRDDAWLRVKAADLAAWHGHLIVAAGRAGVPVPVGEDLDRLARSVQEAVNLLWLPTGTAAWELATGLVRGPVPEVWTLGDWDAAEAAFTRAGVAPIPGDPGASISALVVTAVARETALHVAEATTGR